MLVDDSYYQCDRPEVLALIPDGVQSVVDVGCGAGNLGRSLKKARPGVEVRGIELMPGPAAMAREALDDVHCGAAEAGLPADWPAPQCVILADVLEHLVDPWTALRTWSRILPPGGCVVLSIPNAAHHSALGQLLRGRWPYQDAGVLDRTHLRFFTRASALELVTQADLEIQRVERVLVCPFRGAARNLIRTWARRKSRREPGNGVGPGFSRFLLDYCTIQFLIVASKASGGLPPSAPAAG